MLRAEEVPLANPCVDLTIWPLNQVPPSTQKTTEKCRMKPRPKNHPKMRQGPLRSTKVKSGWIFLPDFHHKSSSLAIKPPKGV